MSIEIKQKTSHNRSTIGARLREERRSRSLTQQNLCDFLGCGKTTIADWESGRATPTAEMLAKTMSIGFDAVYIMSGVRQDAGIEERLNKDELELLDTYRMLPDEDKEDATLRLDSMLLRAVREGRCEYIVKRKQEPEQ